jgi:hypothetical protein
VRKLLIASAFLLAGAVGALAQTPVNAIPLPGTIQGQIVLSANTSTSLVAANVTMAPNSQALPLKNFYVLNYLNESTTNSAYICIGGGTASATSGCTYIGPGATIYLTFPQGVSGGQVAPTLFSLSGATIDFWN